jgi:hypothetical protein
VLTAYESQRRMTRNFLEGARRKRISYTPLGLYQAWRDLDAAKKVYFGTLAGLVLSVCDRPSHFNVHTANRSSSCLLLCCSLAPAASMMPMAFLESPPTTSSAAGEASGMSCQ